MPPNPAQLGLGRVCPSRGWGDRAEARPPGVGEHGRRYGGKITVGYQGWFACAGDGAPINGWWHWSNNWSQPPSPANNAIKAWPDMREYSHGYPTTYANLGNGQPAILFSSYDQQTVDTHFQWMRQYGCDTVALQRFNPNSSEGPTRDAMAAKVCAAAEGYDRRFYIMYDVGGWASMQAEITRSPRHGRLLYQGSSRRPSGPSPSGWTTIVELPPTEPVTSSESCRATATRAESDPAISALSPSDEVWNLRRLIEHLVEA